MVEGITTANPQAELIRKISAQFPDNVVGKKPGRGQNAKPLSYISHALITARLNEVDPNWSMRHVATHTYTGADGRLHCEGVTIEMTVGGATRTESGGPARQDGFANEIKNAMSDAVKRGAMRFGAALYIWDKLVDAEFDEDVYPDLAAQTTAAPASRPPLSPQMREHFAEGYKAEGEVATAARNAPKPAPGHNLPPNGAARLDSKPGQAPRPPAQQAPAVPVPQPSKYGEHAPNGNSTKMVDVNAYLTSKGFDGGNVGQCIKELEGWVTETFHLTDKIVGTGPVNPEKPQYGPGVMPKDIYNYAFHYISQCEDPEEARAAVAAAAGGTHIADDDIPF